jgi:putative transcriptional regulator
MKRRIGFSGALLAMLLPISMRAQDELAQGKILVADKKLKDPNFDQTVVYLITYDEQGAVGLVLNRESDTPLSRVLTGVKEAASRKDFVFTGGPVEASSVLALYRSSAKRKGTRQVSGDVYAVLDEAVLKEALASGSGANALRFYSGYAGWGPGQLDNEVDAGAWSVLPGDAKTVFDGDPDTLWDRLNRRREQQVVKNQWRRRSLFVACAFACLATKGDGLPHFSQTAAQ